jgi:putative colanic acid biosynthesis acetyltransferase WcaF
VSKYYTNKEVFLRLIWGLVLYGWRNFVLRIMGAKIGKGVKIYPSAKIMFPWLLSVGDGSLISWGVKVYNLGHISIGSNTIVSQYAHLCGGTHDYRSPNFTLLRKGLTIGSRVWICADAFIGPGITVGERVVVGARAVALKNVPANSIVAGNPAIVVGNVDMIV